jgi:hypothetical protein
MLKAAFGDECLSRVRTFKWFQRFKRGQISVDDDPRSGRPSKSRNDDSVTPVRELIRANRQLTGREIPAEVGISYGTCQAILTEDLNMRRVSAKFVSRVLTFAHKEHRVFVAATVRQEAETDQNFITGDEIWVYGYDAETKRQSSQWKRPKSPRPKKARHVRSIVKDMLICFFLTWKGLFTMNTSPKVEQ